MSSPISSALEKLDGSLLALQSEVDCLRAGLEVSDDQLTQKLTDARQHATAVRDLIRTERGDAVWSDRKALDQLIRDLELAAREKRNEQRRTRLLELASEFEAASIRHRFESRVSSLNALRQDAIQQLRADASLPEQEKVLPGPDVGEWLHWACNLQEDTDSSALEQLQKDFPAVAIFTSEMEESYWVPGTRAPATAAPKPEPSAPPVKEAKPPEPVRVSKEPAPVVPPAPVIPPAPAPKPPAQASPAVAAAKPTKPVEPAIRPDKQPAPQPVAPALGKAAVATAVATLEKPTVAAQAQPAASTASPAAKAAERPKEVRPAPEPPRAPAPSKQWAAAAAPAAAVAPAKEAPEKKTVAAVTAAAPAPAAPRMKYCDKCGSTYPAQFNVCPIDTSPLRFASEPAPATARDSSSDKKVEAAAVAVAAAATAKQASSKAAEKSASESAKAEFAELRATIRHRTDDEPLAVEEHQATDWQAMLRDKNWRALAANPVVLVGATLLLVLIVGGIILKAHHSRPSNDSVKAMEKAPEQPAATTQPSGIVTNSAAQPLDANLSTQAQAKPVDPNAAKQNPKDAQQKPANQPDNTPTPRQTAVLSLPMPTPGEVAVARKPEAANENIEPPSSIPGALPNTAPNTLGSIAKDVPVAVPTLSTQKLRVSSGVAQAQLTHQVTPQYPPEALQSRVHGTVVLQAVIGRDGNVKNLKVVSGPSMLIKSATEAVKQWRYRPFTLNGEPVEADTQINVNFNLGEQ